MLRYGEALALASYTGREVDVQENANNRKRLPEWIGELPTDAQRAEWARQAINYFTTPQVAILRGQIPARLEAETAYTDPELFKPRSRLTTRARRFGSASKTWSARSCATTRWPRSRTRSGAT